MPSDPNTGLYLETDLLCHTQRKKDVTCHHHLSILLFGCDDFKELKPNFFALTIELTPGGTGTGKVSTVPYLLVRYRYRTWYM
jgi:hypothetical protein